MGDLPPAFARLALCKRRPTCSVGLSFPHAAFRRLLVVHPSSASTEVVDTVVDVEDNVHIPIVTTATIPRNVNVASRMELMSIIVFTSLPGILVLSRMWLGHVHFNGLGLRFLRLRQVEF